MTNVNNKKVISAKTFQGGETIFLTLCNVWSEDVSFAEISNEDEFDWRLALSRRLREVGNASLTDVRENVRGLAERVAA